MSAPIACVGISSYDKLQLVDGAELRQDIIDAVGNYAQDVRDSCPEEVVVKIHGYPWQNRDFDTVRLLMTFAH